MFFEMMVKYQKVKFELKSRFEVLKFNLRMAYATTINKK